MSHDPGYIQLYESGELQERVEKALAMLASCTVCPRDCSVNRLEDKWAVCKTGRWAIVSSYFPHFGEEDCLRGWKGSGTIFFSNCNLKCVFCQNWDISHDGDGRVTKPERLAEMMIDLQQQGCHNINLVTPEHVVPQILEALPIAIERNLKLPIVYNTSAYDSLDSLHLLDGIIDIYMPDFKYWDPEVSRRLSRAKNYPDAAKAAIKEMHRQVGELVLDESGVAKRGLLVRHLVMPGGLAGTKKVMGYLAEELSQNTYVNILAQYHPAGKVGGQNYSDINRRITAGEYEEAIQIAEQEGIHRIDERQLIRKKTDWL